MKTRLWILSAAFATGAWAQDGGAMPLPASGNVTLPLDEYNRLVDLAAKPVKKPDVAPVAFTVKSAELKFQVIGEAATGTVQLEGEVFRQGVSLVPLANGMTILDARQKGAELPLQQTGGTHLAVLPGPGEFSVTLNAGLPLTMEAGRASLQFPVPKAGAARISLLIPGDHTAVNLTPGLITSRTSANGQTSVDATLVPGEPATIWWAVREAAPQVAPREVRFLSDVKTLVSASDAELSLTALADITVVQGDAAQFEILLPAGYEVTGATGSTLESTDVQAGRLILRVANAAQRSHQFLVSLTKSNVEAKAEIPILTLQNAQRETGEVLVEGEGAMEMTAQEAGSLKRMDLKEVSPYLMALSRNPPQAAFRYHRQAGEVPALSLAWVRFPESSVLAAIAPEAEVTTMVTSDGKSLTEVKLTIRNQAQPFLKVSLPAGANIVSAEVAGQRVKPVQGADGDRVPLLRAGFRPTGTYTMSFVYMDSGAPFAKKGGSELALPKMDVPIGFVRWEVFLPERYKVTDFGGDAMVANLMPAAFSGRVNGMVTDSLALPGRLGGVVTDPTGASIPGAQVTVTEMATGAVWHAISDMSGQWTVPGVASGRIRLTVQRAGFRVAQYMMEYDGSRPAFYPTKLEVGQATESVTLTAADSPAQGGGRGGGVGSRDAKESPPMSAPKEEQASANVVNLQRRVAGVLPIAIDVPHAGTSFRFVRPLVVDEETKVTFRYKTK